MLPKSTRVQTVRQGNRKVSVFPSPGKFWKTRWVAFPESDEFKYFKGEQDEAFKWAAKYLDGKV